MRGVLHLATRSLLHHRLRSALIATAVGATVLLPLLVGRLVERYQIELERRAEATPLVIGAKGSRYDLVLSALYYRGRVPEPLTRADCDEVVASGYAEAVPLHLGHRSAGGGEEGAPVVGTDLDYYRLRGLAVARGGLPALLGDAVLGAELAAERGLGPGDSLLTRAGNLHVFSGSYPLRLNVVGVLAASGGPDDGAVFVDLPTAWLADGIGHGHDPAEEQDPDAVLTADERAIVLSDKVYEFTQVTADNIGGFHFHGDEAERPISAVLAWPHDDASRTKLKGRYVGHEHAQILQPTVVVGELLGFVFRLKVFFDANSALVALATLLFLVVIVLLGVQVRAAERETLHRMGCPRGTVLRLFATELLVLVGGGASVAALGAWALGAWLWSLVGV